MVKGRAVPMPLIVYYSQQGVRAKSHYYYGASAVGDPVCFLSSPQMDTHLAMSGKGSSFSVKDILDLPEAKAGESCSPVHSDTSAVSPANLALQHVADGRAGLPQPQQHNLLRQREPVHTLAAEQRQHALL